MNKLERLEPYRKWLTTVVTILIVPMLGLLLENTQMKVKADVAKEFVSKVEHSTYVSEHKDWGNEQVKTLRAEGLLVTQRQDKMAADTDAKLNAMSAKIDMLLINLNTLQVQMGMLKKSVENGNPK